MINTSDLNAKETDSLSDATPNDEVILGFEPQDAALPLTGTTYTKMSIRATKDAYNAATLTNQNVTVHVLTEEDIEDLYNETLNLKVTPLISILVSFSNTLRSTNLTYKITSWDNSNISNVNI